MYIANQHKVLFCAKKHGTWWVDGWMDGWMDGWVGVRAGLRIDFSN